MRAGTMVMLLGLGLAAWPAPYARAAKPNAAPVPSTSRFT